MRFVAGRCAEAELLAGQGAVTERHREDVAGRGAVAAEMLLSRTLLAEKSKAASGRCCWPGTPEWAITSLAHHA